MHIYINEETEEKLKKLANSGIYKKNSASYIIKYLIEKEEKYTENTRKIIEENKQRKKELEQKFGSEKDIIELAQFDWVNNNE